MKICGDRLGGRRIERAVGGDDPAEGRHAVAGERFLPGIEQAVARRNAAGIGVLDDDDGRSAVAELGDELERGIGVVEIVVAELLALDLLGLGDAARRGSDGQIKRRLLMRVLAVAQRHLELARTGPGLAASARPGRQRRTIARWSNHMRQ